MTKPIYTARLTSCTQATDPATGAPRPLKITLIIPSYATGLAILRDFAAGRLPITLTIDAVQPPLPEPE